MRGLATGAGVEYDCVGRSKLGDGLTAGAAGLAGGFVEVIDRDGADADGGAVGGDCGGDGSLFGAGGQPIRGILDVAAGDNLPGFEQDGRAHVKAAVRRVGVVRDGFGGGGELRELGVELAGVGRHRLRVEGI